MKKEKRKVKHKQKYLKALLKIRGVFFCKKALKIFFILHIRFVLVIKAGIKKALNCTLKILKKGEKR